MRRIVDFLVIVIMAAGLLAVAWHLSTSPADRKLPPYQVNVESEHKRTGLGLPELPLLVPIENIGMSLSREAVPGTAQHGVAHLEQRCREVLSVEATWVLPLVVTPEEQRLLDSTSAASPDSVTNVSPHAILYSLRSPTTRIGVRGPVGEGAATGRRLLCWGFIAAEGTEQQTVWFARPRQNLASDSVPGAFVQGVTP